MSNSPDYFIFAGEASGDLLGYHVMQEILDKHPQAVIQGVFGPKMRSFGFQPIMDTEAFHVMGFIDVIKNMKRLIKAFYYIRNHLLAHPPKHLILIDYPGFNLRLAKSLKKQGFPSPITQYVCPSIWAWKYSRVKHLKCWVDQVGCLFPFETLYLKHAKAQGSYVGHPLAKISLLPKISFENKSPLILIFPGSRRGEILRNLSIQIEAALAAPSEYSIGISAATPELAHLIEKQLTQLQQERIFVFPSKENAMLMEQASCALATSGTITLELALYHLPTLVCYKLSWLDYLAAKYIFDINLPFYSIVNFLAQKPIFPEYYGPRLCSKKLGEDLINLINSKEALKKMYLDTFLIENILKQPAEASII